MQPKNLTTALLALACLTLTPAGTPAAQAAEPTAPVMIALDSGAGVDLEDDNAIAKHGSSRTGHAAFTPAEVKKALAAMPKDQVSKYQAVRQKLATYRAAQAQLDALCAKKRLKYADASRHTVLDNLYTLANEAPAHGIDTTKLLSEVVADVARPSTIAQAGHSTCSATSIQAALARQKPAEYCRIVAGLATGDGNVQAGNGLGMSSADYIPFKDRTISSNLMQPAIMELEARVEGGHYQNKADKIFPKSGKPHGGAYNDDVSATETALLGAKYVTLDASSSNRDKIMSIVGHASAKYPVLAGMMMAGGGGHEVQVTGYDKAKGVVVIRNPWGELDYIPAAKFKQAVDGVNYKAQ